MKKFVKASVSVLTALLISTGSLGLGVNIPNVSVAICANAEELSAPSGFKSTTTANTIKLSWDKVEGATAYRVYMYNSSKKIFEKYANVVSNSCKIKKLKKNTKYVFKVATLTTKDGKYVENECSAKISATTKADNYPSAPKKGCTGFYEINGGKYYFENGKVAKGMKKIDSDYYYFTESGMLKGWLNKYEIYYFFNSEGKMVRGKTVSIGGEKYKFKSNGQLEWDDDATEPKAKHTIKGEEPDISIFMSSTADSKKSFVICIITNDGDKDLYVHNVGLLKDSDYSSYDRALRLTKIDGTPITYQKIGAGESKTVIFEVLGTPTWYDKKSTLGFYVKYDNTTYIVFANGQYGKYYQTAAHKDIEEN